MIVRNRKHLARAVCAAFAVAAMPVAAQTLTPVGPLDAYVLGILDYFAKYPA